MRALAEDLEFPLALGHFGVDAFVVDAGVEAEVEVLFDDGAGDAAHVLVADAAVVGALRAGVAVLREAERTAVLVEEVLLLEAEPDIRIVRSGGAHVGGVRRAIGVHDFAQHDVGVLAGRVGIESHRLQNAVGAFAFGLHGGAAVKSPQGQIGKRGRLFKVLDRGLAAQFGTGFLPSSQMYSSLYFAMSLLQAGRVEWMQKNPRACDIRNP